MTVHELKIWPQYYYAVSVRDKLFEVRENDRNFQRGDYCKLRYFDPEFKFPNPLFTEQEMRDQWDKEFPPLFFQLGYVLPLGEAGSKVVFSLLETDREFPEPPGCSTGKNTPLGVDEKGNVVWVGKPNADQDGSKS